MIMNNNHMIYLRFICRITWMFIAAHGGATGVSSTHASAWLGPAATWYPGMAPIWAWSFQVFDLVQKMPKKKPPKWLIL